MQSAQSPDRTADPDPVEARAFVVQQVEVQKASRLLLGLQFGDRVVTWLLETGLPVADAGPLVMEQLPERTLRALVYEGVVEEVTAANRKWQTVDSVKVWDRGDLVVKADSENELEIQLFGSRVQGAFVLRARNEPEWEIEYTAHADQPWSPLPEPFPAMDASDGPLPDDFDWVYEPRWRGMRSRAALTEDGRMSLDAMGTDCNDRFPEFADLSSATSATQLLLEGVVVVLDADRMPNPDALEERIAGRSVIAPATFVAFDLLHLDGRPMLQLPYRYRREKLEQLKLRGSPWAISPRLTHTSLQAAIEASRAHALHGIVAKRSGSPYEPGQKTENWRIIDG